MQIIDNAGRQCARLPGIEHRTLACADDGLEALSLWQQSLAPGAVTPPHHHDCEELVVVTAGRGMLRVGGEAREFGPGTTLVIPAGASHQLVSLGPGSLEVMAVFGATPVGTFGPDGTELDLPWRS